MTLVHHLGLGRGRCHAGLSVGLRPSIGETSACGPRTENQDALRVITPVLVLAANKGHSLATADGASQCADGSLAARSSPQALALDYYATPETRAIVQSLDCLLLAQDRWPQVNDGGQLLLTTLTALVLRGIRYTLTHVGDYRAYLRRDGELLWQTSDHVWEQPHIQHVLTCALGLDQYLVVNYLEGDLEPDSQWLLVSGGVQTTLGDNGIRSILCNAEEPQRSAEALVRAVHLTSSQDSVSALLVRVEAVPAGSLGDTLAQLGHWPLLPLLKPDQLFEGWRVRQSPGESRQSLLYRVEDGQGQPWLLKTLPAVRADDPLATQTLLLEEWFLRRVQGRHFSELHGLAQRQHLYYLMREHPGKTLAEYLRDHGPLPLPEQLGLANQLLRGLGQLHRRNLLHRDPKPENLHLGRDDELRLLDLGLAWCPGLLHEDPHLLPSTSSCLASECFPDTPPSVCQDLYVIGVCLCQALTGRYPYGEIGAFQHPRFGRPVPPNRYRLGLPAWTDDLLLHAVAYDPTQHFEATKEWLLSL